MCPARANYTWTARSALTSAVGWLALLTATACGGDEASNSGIPTSNTSTSSSTVGGGGGTGTGTTQGTTQGTPSTDTSTSTTGATGGYSVTVDAATPWGALPHFWNTYGIGRLGLFLQEDRGWGQTLKDHVVDGVQNLGLTSIRAHGMFHDDIGMYREEDGVPVYDFTRSDEIFDFLVGEGVEPIVELADMPSALASDPSQVVFDWDMGISPPKDFTLWQELVFQFVQHSVERYGEEVVNEWYFEVWNEPECCSGKFWKGTLDQYFELYDHSVEGVRRALPTGRVGGPVASQPLELIDNSEVGIKFLDHVTTDNYVHPGMPGELDFFAYHSWSFIEGAVGGYFQGLDLLDSYGFDEVNITVTEFGPTWEFNLYDEPAEMHQGAAFVAQIYSNIAQRCAKENRRFPATYAWWVLSDIFDEQEQREDDPFIGCMGLTSRENIRKPAYNAYKFLAQMGDEQMPLEVTGPGGGVGGMAARAADGGVQILLYNGQNPGKGSADDTYYEVAAAQPIDITVSGLDAASPYDVTAYRVDESHGNAYATWEAQGRPAMSTMTEENWQALRDTMDSPAEPLPSHSGETFAGSFELSSPGVLFVTLHPAAP